MLDMVIEGLNAILDNPSSPFLTGTVMDILFNGIPLNCVGDNFAAEAICAALVNDGGMEKINETHIGFALFKSVRSKFFIFFLFISNNYYIV